MAAQFLGALGEQHVAFAAVDTGMSTAASRKRLPAIISCMSGLSVWSP